MSNFTYSGYTYTGKDSTEWYAKFLYGAPSLERLKVMPNVKSKMQVPNLNVLEASKVKSCNFTAGGEIEVDTREISVTTIDVNLEVCEEDLEVLFISEDMKPGSNNQGDFTPATLNNMIMEQTALKVSEEVEFMIWQGDTAGATSTYLDLIDGLEKKMAADANVVAVVGTTLTVANILTEIDKVIAVVPKQMLRRKKLENVGIGMNLGTYEMFLQALRNSTFSPTIVIDQPDMVPYNGYKIYAFDGMSDDTMVFADFNRIWVGTDLVSDITDIKIIAMNETTGDSMIRIKGRYKLGVQYAVSEEIVFYQ
jgi:hypothetical protein